MKFISKSERETAEIGKKLSEKLKSGDTVAFYGDLGAGKTHFVSAIAEGMGFSGETSSPTFALVNEYIGGRLNLYHFDMYRISDWEDLYSSGFFAADLKEIRLADTDETIPTFAEVLALVNGRVPLLIELKGETTDVSLCAPVAALLRDYRGPYCIESFNPMLLGEMKKHLPDVCRGMLYTNVCHEKKRYSLLNMLLTAMALNVIAKPDFIAYNQVYRHSLPVRITTRLYHAPHLVWTTRGDRERAEARAHGEHAIFEVYEKE